MNRDVCGRRRWGASAAVGAALAAAVIPVAPAFAEPDGAAAIGGGGPGCCEALADKDLFEFLIGHDGLSATAASADVAALNADLAGLSNPGATVVEEMVIAFFGGGAGMPEFAAAAVP